MRQERNIEDQGLEQLQWEEDEYRPTDKEPFMNDLQREYSLLTVSCRDQRLPKTARSKAASRKPALPSCASAC